MVGVFGAALEEVSCNWGRREVCWFYILPLGSSQVRDRQYETWGNEFWWLVVSCISYPHHAPP
jgi:hypothetical protein